MSPWTARAALVGLFLLFSFTSTIEIPVPPAAPPAIVAAGITDTVLFESVVERLRQGEPYYEAMGSALRRWLYPSASVFNWRTPVLFETIAAVGLRAAWWMLAALCAAVLVLAIPLFERRTGAGPTVVGVVALLGAFLVTTAPNMLVHAEGWCGALIALSVLAYARGSWWPGAVAGLSALFVRELAAPYCAIAAVFALRARRWRELTFWIVGMGVYLLSYGYHVSAVHAHRTAADLAFEGSWLRWGGLPFLLETMQQCNSLLLNRPQILTSVAILLAASSLFAVEAPRHAKALTAWYSAFFLIAGYQFNDYWGLVTAPVVAISISFGPSGLQRLLKSARGLQPATRAAR